MFFENGDFWFGGKFKLVKKFELWYQKTRIQRTCDPSLSMCNAPQQLRCCEYTYVRKIYTSPNYVVLKSDELNLKSLTKIYFQYVFSSQWAKISMQ